MRRGEAAGARIQASRDRAAIASFCRELVRTPSPSGDEQAAAELVAQQMRELRIGPVEIDRWGNVVGTVVAPDHEGDPILLIAHLDHVDAGDAAAWRHAPFDGAIEDGRLFGRGATDTKSAIAAQVYAAQSLRASVNYGCPLRRDVVIAAVVQEEVGGLGAAGLLEDGRKFSAAVIGEPSQGRLAIGHRGRVEIEVTFHGRAAHASRPDRAVNPHEALARFVLRLGELPHDEDPVFGRSSVAPTQVRARPTSVNVTPEEITLTLDWRHVASEAPSDVLARVRAVASRDLPTGVMVDVSLASATLRAWTGLEREIPRVSRAFATEASSPIVTGVRAELGAAFERDIEVIPWDFASDGGWLAAAGIPCIGYGPGDMTLMHVTDESVSLDLVEECAAGYAVAALALDDALSRPS